MNKLLFLFLLLHFSAFSQYSEGYMKYSINVIPVDTTQENLTAARMLRNSKIEISFSKDKYRIDTHMGDISQSSIIYNHPLDEILALSSNSTNLLAQKFSIDDAKFKQPVAGNAQVTEYRDSTKKILGFDCYYVELIDAGSFSSYWCTEQIDFEFHGQSIVNPSIPGFPMWIRREENGFEFTYIASNFVDHVSNEAVVFSTTIPDGYKDLTPSAH